MNDDQQTFNGAAQELRENVLLLIDLMVFKPATPLLLLVDRWLKRLLERLS